MQIINFSLIKHPMNWLTLILMIVIFGLAVHLVLDFYGISPGKEENS